MTDDSAFKKQVRARMAETGENYTTARRMVTAGRDPGQPPVALRVYLNPHVDLQLADEAARAYAAGDEPGQRDMANRLLAAHIEMAGSEEAGVAAGSEIMTVQALLIEEINDLIRRRIGRAAGVSAVGVSDDLDHVRVTISRRPAGRGARPWPRGDRPAPRRAGGADRQAGGAEHRWTRLARGSGRGTRGPGILRAEDRGRRLRAAAARWS